MRGWLRTGVGAIVAFGGMAMAWRASGWAEQAGTWQHGRLPERLPFEATAWTPWVALAIAVTLAGVVLLRWRPLAGYVVGLAGLVVYAAAGGPSFGVFLPALVLALGLVRALGLASAGPWLALVPLALWATWWDKPALGLTDWRMWWMVGSTTVWVLLPTLFMALAMTRHQAAARERADAVRRAASEERLRLAREIHDVVGHSLSLISLQSAVALRVLDADPAQARASLEAIRGSSKDALAELRHTLGVFRGEPGDDTDRTPLAPTPTLAAIAGLVGDVRAVGVRVDLSPLPSADAVGVGVQAVAYRVVQEALTNAIRHAPRAAVRVAVARGDGELRVVVTDDGHPSGDVVEGAGLRGMRERVEALAGSLRVGPTPQGFAVEARLPIDEGAA